MTTAHTPGPWEYDGLTPAHNHPAIMDPTGTIQLAHVLTGRNLEGKRVDEFEADANARLIAAAPELLAALRLFLGLMDLAAPAIKGEPEYKAARAAIAKAEGGAA